jgi:SulP family sulfate permease
MAAKTIQGSKWEGFSTKALAGDMSAGLTKAIDSVTGGMANAVLAGVNPVHGLYTALAATPIGAIFTSSVVMNIDSTGAIAATAGSMLLIYPPEQRSQALVALTLLVAAFMLAAGLLKLGFLTRFISNAVLRGFITGIAVNIILGQLSDFTGYSSAFSNKVIKGLDTIVHFNQVDWPTLLVGMVTVTLIVVLDRTRLNKASLLIALVVASALVPLLNFTTVPLVSSLGPMPDALPRPALPDLSFVPSLIGPAFALTIIALAQSAGISQSYVNPNGKYPDASRDFTGQGMANVAGALFQSLPAGGSMSGTALLVKGGARSRWANIFTGLFAAIIILLFGALVGRLAMAALAGLLIVAGFQTIKFGEISKILNTSKTSSALMIATFVATLIVPLQTAIFFGVALSFAIFAYQQSEAATITEITSMESGMPVEQTAPAALPSNKITLLNTYGSLFFAGARNLEEDLPKVEGTRNAVVILSLRGQAEVGSTLIQVLERYAAALKAGGNTLMLAGVAPHVQEQFAETHCIDLIGKENVFITGKPDQSAAQAMQQAQRLVSNPPTAGELAPQLNG